MSPAPTLDLDTAELTMPGAAPVELSATAIAAVALFKFGYDRARVLARLGDAAGAALDELANHGVSPETAGAIMIPGHVFHPDPVPPEARTVAVALARRAAEAPDGIALIVEDPLDPDAEPLSVSAAELHELVETVADRLAGAGLGPGDHIALSVAPSLEAVVLCHAAWEVGASVALIREYLADDFLEAMRERVAPAFWFMGGPVRDGFDPATWIRLSVGGATTAFEDWLEAGTPARRRAPPDADREAAIVMTSGSTGEPKMLALPHRALYGSGRYALITDPPADAPRQGAATDLSAMSGFRTTILLPAMSRAATVILAPESRDSSLKILAAFGRHSVTHAQVIPRTLGAAAEVGRDRLEALGLGTLVCAVSGTGVLHENVRARAEAALGCEVRDQFGPNESAGAFSFSRDSTLAQGGVVANDLLIRIVDDDGVAVPKGTVGSVAMFGERLFAGRYGPDGYEPRPPGWFVSGDLGRRLPSGNFTIAGRNHDAIKTVEGEFLAPTAVEDAASAHPAVREAVVVRLPATEAGERYALAVETDGEGEALKRALTALITDRLGAFAGPAAIVLAPALPRVANQKPDRIALAALVEREA